MYNAVLCLVSRPKSQEELVRYRKTRMTKTTIGFSPSYRNVYTVNVYVVGEAFVYALFNKPQMVRVAYSLGCPPMCMINQWKDETR